MEIVKSKSLNIALVLSLTMSTCYTQAFWPTQLIKKGFSTVKSKLLGASKKNTGISRKKLALGITAAAAVLVAVVYGIFKISGSTGQTDPDNELLDACKTGNLDEVKRLHEQGADLQHEKIGILPSQRNYGKIVKIGSHKLVQATTYKGRKHIGGRKNVLKGPVVTTIQTPMSYAVANGDIEMIQYLLDQGVGFETDLRRHSKLYTYGHHTCLGLLKKDRVLGSNLLKVAIQAAIEDLEKFEVVQLLVENGAEIHLNPIKSWNPNLVNTYVNPNKTEQIQNREIILKYLIDNGLILDYGIYYRSREIIEEYARKYIKYARKYIKYVGGLHREEGKRLDFTGSFHTGNYKGCCDNNVNCRGISVPTEELEEMLNNGENCPCYLRQRALVALFARYIANDKTLSSKKQELEAFFASVPFNQEFLKELHRVNAIKFIVQNNITDKFGRDALKACTQCCQDEDVINAVIANRFEQFGGQNNSHPKDARLFINNLGLKKKALRQAQDGTQQDERGKTGELEDILLYAKKRNKKVYNQLFKRTCFYAHINGKKLTRDGEVASQIVSFLDKSSVDEITNKVFTTKDVTVE